MAKHSQDGLQGDVSLGVEAGTGPASGNAAALPGGLRADEIFGHGDGTEFRPIFEGNEASRSAQTFATLTEYVVPADRYALLDEAAADIASNGEARFAIPGNDPVTFTGDREVNLVFDGAVLLPGSVVRILHQSSDGASTTTRGLITAREV